MEISSRGVPLLRGNQQFGVNAMKDKVLTAASFAFLRVMMVRLLVQSSLKTAG